MVFAYMIIGTVAGLLASFWMGTATGSVALALLAWPVVGSVIVLVLAFAVFARSEMSERRNEASLYPAE